MIAEDYFILGFGFFILIVGIFSTIKPKLFVSKNTPKVHPYFYIDSKKYIKIRGWVFIVLGVLLILISITELL